MNIMGLMIYYSLCMGLFILAFSFAEESHGNIISCPNLDSIFQFGDSLADTGNSVRTPVIGPFLPAARLPYGETYGTSTGRYSDGLLIIDYFASAVGLPRLDPYLDKDANFSNGVNFAVAGATALDYLFFAARGIIVLPAANLPSKSDGSNITLPPYVLHQQAQCSTKLGRSLVWMGEIGGNDINFAYLQGKSLQEIRTYIPFITQAIITNIREVILHGATRIVVPGNFPIGCLPVVLTLVSESNPGPEEFDEFGCSRSYNDLAIYQNSYLQNALASLRVEFPNVRLAYADYYGAFRSVLGRASLLGFNTGGSVLKACCGIGGEYNYNSIIIGCGSPGVPVCPNPSSYISWDGIHLTQEAYRRVSEVLIPSILSQIQCS